MRPALGTLVEIRATGQESVLPGIAAAFAAIERVERLMSFHDQRSDVSRINAAQTDQVIAIDAETHAVLSAARTIGDLSGGVFDIGTAATLVRSGFLPEPRRSASERETVSDATYRDLELLPRSRVRWRRPGWIDLGGIAKGYAVDRAVAALRAHGVASGIVNAGGDLRCFGDPQPIFVRASDEPTALLSLGTLTDAAIASSAGYFRGLEIDGEHVHPLVDPSRAACISWEQSISVAAADCMTADALTKVVRLAPQAVLILERFGAHAVIDDRHGRRAYGTEWLIR